MTTQDEQLAHRILTFAQRLEAGGTDPLDVVDGLQAVAISAALRLRGPEATANWLYSLAAAIQAPDQAASRH